MSGDEGCSWGRWGGGGRGERTVEECVHDVSREGEQLMGGEVFFFRSSRLSAVVEEGRLLEG